MLQKQGFADFIPGQDANIKRIGPYIPKEPSQPSNQLKMANPVAALVSVAACEPLQPLDKAIQGTWGVPGNFPCGSMLWPHDCDQSLSVSLAKFKAWTSELLTQQKVALQPVLDVSEAVVLLHTEHVPLQFCGVKWPCEPGELYAPIGAQFPYTLKGDAIARVASMLDPNSGRHSILLCSYAAVEAGFEYTGVYTILPAHFILMALFGQPREGCWTYQSKGKYNKVISPWFNNLVWQCALMSHSMRYAGNPTHMHSHFPDQHVLRSRLGPKPPCAEQHCR